METLARTAEGHLDATPITDSRSSGFNAAFFRQTASNLGIAFIFFLALWSHLRVYHNFGEFSREMRSYGGWADLVWMVGAALMGVLSLIRFPPVATLVNFWSLFATTAMMIVPTFIRAEPGATGTMALIGLTVECFGVVLSEGSRVYLGRRFGLLPANRGIIASGPFAVVRHPIYSGWFILTIGLVMASTTTANLTTSHTLTNFVLLAFMVPITIVRMNTEEELLVQDPAYANYCKRTRYRLFPFIY